MMRVRKKTKAPKNVWPFPEGIGDDIPGEWRPYHIPKDDYYYLSFPYKNSVEETTDNLKLLAELGLPFEYSKSPSGCICYRLHRKYENLPEIRREPGPKETVPVIMPALQYGRRTEWRMSQQNSLSFLFTSWQSIVATRRRRRKKVSQPKKRVRRKT